MSQWQDIYKHMKSGKTITTYQAYSKFKCTRLPDRIRDIERIAYVGRKWKKVGKKQVMEYYL